MERAPLLISKDKGSLDLLNSAKDLFSTHPIYIKEDSELVFVCGGAITSQKTSYRKHFLDAFKSFKFKKGLKLILSEKAFETLTLANDFEPVNLIEFEELIAGIAFCVIIFIETPGAIAELGYFCSKEVICKKLLLVSDIAFNTTDSFINKGPIDVATTIFRSKFGQIIYLPKITQKNKKNFDFSGVLSVINSKISAHDRRKRFEYSKAFKKTNKSKNNKQHLFELEELFAVLEVINLFQIITQKDLMFVFERIFGVKRIDHKKLVWVITLLAGSGFIKLSLDKNNVDLCIFKNKKFETFFQLEHSSKDITPKNFSSLSDYGNLQVEIRSFYAIRRPDLLKQWEELE